MQDAVRSTFASRLNEIELYLDFVDSVLANTHSGHHSSTTPGASSQSPSDLHKVLKATAFLLLYNLVESTIKKAIAATFEGIKLRRLTYDDVTDEIRALWISSRFRKAFDPSANWSLGRDLAREMVDAAVAKSILDLAEEADLPVSGNLDARAIRELLGRIGAPTHVDDEAAKGGCCLKIIREKRNALAHGDLSFAEVGRDFTIGQLRQYKAEVAAYLVCMLENIFGHANQGGYRRTVTTTS